MPVLFFLLGLILWLFLLNLVESGNCYILEYFISLLSSSSFSMVLIFDHVSVMFSLIVMTISFCVFLFASEYMSNDPFFNRFVLILFSFVGSMNVLIFSGSMIILLLGWDGLGLSSFALIIYYQSKSSLSAGFQTLMTNRLGDVLIVCSFVVLLGFGTFSILSVSLGTLLIWAVASFTKSAQYPFCSWLPAAMAAPTPVSALVHSSTLVTAGVYLMVRVGMFLEFSNVAKLMFLLAGSITSVLGGLSAFVENDLKKIIALSTLSQLGVMVFSLGLGQVFLAMFHLVTHALFKALLFLCAGVVLMSSFGSQDIRVIKSISLPLYVIVCMNISAVSLVGVPFVSSFFSKHAILEMAFFSSSISFVSLFLMLLSGGLSALYTVRMLSMLVWSGSKSLFSLSMSPCSFSLIGAVLPLSLGAIFSGKLINILLYDYFFYMVVPSYVFNILSFLSIVGLAFFLIMIYLKADLISLSSMFFLSPSLSGMPFCIMFLLKGVKSLEWGWLEPISYNLSNFLSGAGVLTMPFTWPASKSVLFMASLSLSLVVLFLLGFV